MRRKLNVFQIVHKRSEAAKKAENSEANLSGYRKVDSATPRADYMRDRRRLFRLQLLNYLVPDRVCPGCKRKVIGSRRWIVKDGKARCVSCSRGRRRKKFTKRVPVRGMDVIRARGYLTQISFAKMLGIPCITLRRLEANDLNMVNPRIAKRICRQINPSV